MKITEYSKVTSLDDSNVFLLDGDDGTKGILAPDMAQSLNGLLTIAQLFSGKDLSSLTAGTPASGDALILGNSDGVYSLAADDAIWELLDAFATEHTRRTTFRGKYLGSTVTAAQMANVQDGSFKGFFLGDYWTIGDVNWRIADINYWYNCGDTAFTTPHLIIVPDSCLYSAQMNTSNVTTGAYVGSAMYTSNLDTAKSTISGAFGDYLLTHRNHLQNAVTSGYESGGTWYDSTVELMNECMVYGHRHFGSVMNGTAVPNIYVIDKTQLALFMVARRFIDIRATYWLRDVVSAMTFALVGSFGYAAFANASDSHGVRPVFAIG